MIYFPKEDSYLLSSIIKEQKIDRKTKILDVGSGSGIQAKTAINQGALKKNVLAIDIDDEVINHLKKEKLNTRQSNLFSKIKKSEKFDLIFFNPPYLPEHKYDKKPDTTGGKKGYEIIIKFLKQAKNHLNKNGKILLLFSNYSHPNIIKREAKKYYSIKKIKEQKVFFENLYVYELSVS